MSKDAVVNPSYTAKHLPLTSLSEIYRQALEQAEQAEAVAWINYLRARESRLALERDCYRVTLLPLE